MHTFFLAPEFWREPYILDGQEARHLGKVLRLKTGDLVRLLDGAGRSGEFVISSSGKNSVELELRREEQHSRPPFHCVLAAAYTKATRRSWLLEKAVELEAGGIWFWQAERSQAKVPEAGKENWQEQLIAGAKQCLNPYLPELRTFPEGGPELARALPGFDKTFLLWEDESSDNMISLEDLTAAPLAHGQPENNGKTDRPQSLLFIMGPEGGLSAGEADLFRAAGAKSLSLGRRVLRWETAALLCLGLAYWAGQLKNARLA